MSKSLKAINAVLLEALQHYANTKNWDMDLDGTPRQWLEPDSNARDVYEGFDLAQKAIAKIGGAS